MARRQFSPGDWVVFRRLKHTTHPGHRAQYVHASPNGDEYNYVVDKFWVVAAIESDGRLLLQTRRGKTHVVDAEDPNLRPASLWDRIRYRGRFIQLPPATQAT